MNSLKQLFLRRTRQAEGDKISPAQPLVLVADVPEIDEENIPQSPPPLKVMPLTFMKRFCFVPLEDSAESITVAMANPLDFSTREAILNAYGKPLNIVRASEETISQFIYRWYEAEADMTAEKGKNAEDVLLTAEDQLWDDPEHLKDMASEAPVIRLVNHLINNAIEFRSVTA